MDFSLLLLVVIGGAVAAVKIMAWVFGPVDQAAKDGRFPTQFTVLDLMCLFFLLQLSMGVPHSLISPIDLRWVETTEIWVVRGLGCIALLMMWAASVQRLSRARIMNTWHRAIFLAFVLPTAFICSICVTVILIVLWLMSERAVFVAPSDVWIFWVIEVCAIAALVVAGILSRWILAASRTIAEISQTSEKRDDIPQQPTKSNRP